MLLCFDLFKFVLKLLLWVFLGGSFWLIFGVLEVDLLDLRAISRGPIVVLFKFDLWKLGSKLVKI